MLNAFVCCAGEGAIARLPVPETLRLDTARMHAAQVGPCHCCHWPSAAGLGPALQRSSHVLGVAKLTASRSTAVAAAAALQGEFQQLVVLTTCLLLVRQGAAATGKVSLRTDIAPGSLLAMFLVSACSHASVTARPHMPWCLAAALQAFGAAEAAVAKRRLGALLADPAMRLPDLAAECISLSGEPPVAGWQSAFAGGCHVCAGQGWFKLINSDGSLLLPLMSACRW